MFLFLLCPLLPEQSPSSPGHGGATFRVDCSRLYDILCAMLREDQSTLLLYLLLHRNQTMKSFILSRTNIDQLVGQIWGLR